MKKVNGKLQKVIVPIAGAKPNDNRNTISSNEYQPGAIIKKLVGQDDDATTPQKR